MTHRIYCRCLAGLVSKYVPTDFEGKKRRITSIDYRPDGQEVLVSYSSDYIYIFDPNVSRIFIINFFAETFLNRSYQRNSNKSNILFRKTMNLVQQGYMSDEKRNKKNPKKK